MSARVTPRRAFALVLALGAAFVACDNRACLAQSELFAGYRDELIDECCLCLARRGTAFPGAACGLAEVTVDGGLSVAQDAGPFVPGATDGEEFAGDDLDDVVQEESEIPCMCTGTAATCQAALGEGRSIVVTGACISQGTGLFVEAPCEEACRDVLTFDPLASAE